MWKGREIESIWSASKSRTQGTTLDEVFPNGYLRKHHEWLIFSFLTDKETKSPTCEITCSRKHI